MCHAPDSVLFLTLSLLAIATVLYLPAHVKTMSSRAYYYFAGASEQVVAGAGSAGVRMGMGGAGMGEMM